VSFDQIGMVCRPSGDYPFRSVGRTLTLSLLSGPIGEITTVIYVEQPPAWLAALAKSEIPRGFDQGVWPEVAA
jgi:hypothetical protein